MLQQQRIDLDLEGLNTGLAAERRSARLTQEATEARAAAVELEAENAALRAALDRQRDEMESLSLLRHERDDLSQRVDLLERKLAARLKREGELMLQLKEAECEKERLRTLLAGTVWFDAKVV